MTRRPPHSRLMYQYRSLADREIRLLRVKNSSDDDAIGYSIHHVQLDQAPEYETVSYVWGKDYASDTIALDNGSILPVTASIAQSLPRIAKACKTGYLWLDQVTINQRDTSERNAQVKIMGTIFKKCSRCLIWLGTDPCGTTPDHEAVWSRRVGQAVREFFRLFPDEDPNLRMPATQDSTTEERIASSPLFSRNASKTRQSLASDDLLWFLQHEWFSRTWVYQEFVLAPHSTFLIGDFELPGHEVTRIFKGGWVRSYTLADMFDQVVSTSRFQGGLFRDAPAVNFLIAAVSVRVSLPHQCDDHLVNYESLGFVNALETMAGSRARDDRDHVYALVGLAPSLLNHMRVDYSFSVEEAFAAMMKALVKESRSLDFFANLPFESDISKSKLRLPSWVSNWTHYASNVNMLGFDNNFMACGKGFGLPDISKCEHTDPAGAAWNELQVAGKIIDTICIVLRQYSPYQVQQARDIKFETHQGLLPWEMSTLQVFMGELNRLGARNVSMKALLRTLLMDCVRWPAMDLLTSGIANKDLYRKGIVTFTAPHYQQAEDLISTLTESMHPDLKALPHEANCYVLHELSRIQYRRRVAYCVSGKLAMAPDLVEVDDKIAILHGSRTPVLLRARPDGKYSVIGQCYHDGSMYGAMADPNDRAADIFTLA